MNKPLVILVVIVGGYLALEQAGKSWRQHLKNDPYAPQLDTSGAKKVIVEMDRSWATAADRFSTGDFHESKSWLEAGWVPLHGFTARFGDKPFDDGLTLKAWLNDHQAKWAASLNARRSSVVRSLADSADVGSLEMLRQRVADPKFDEYCAGVRAEVARLITAHGSALVVQMNQTQTPRSRMMACLGKLRPPSGVYLVFGNAADAAALGDLAFVGLVRATLYDVQTPYEVGFVAGPSADGPIVGPGGSDPGRVGVVTRIDFLLEPDPYAKKNLGLEHRSCSSIQADLPERINLGKRDPNEFIASHVETITKSLEVTVSQLPKFVLRSNPEFGFCSLRPRPLMAGNEMPRVTEDSAIEKAYTFRN